MHDFEIVRPREDEWEIKRLRRNDYIWVGDFDFSAMLSIEAVLSEEPVQQFYNAVDYRVTEGVKFGYALWVKKEDIRKYQMMGPYMASFIKPLEEEIKPVQTQLKVK